VNLDDVIRIARRLWPRGFACAYVVWVEKLREIERSRGVAS